MLLAALAALLVPQPLWAGGFEIADRFGRSLTNQPVTLVDWEGHIANPTVEIFIAPPSQAGPFPTTATISADSARLYFDLPSRIGAEGPAKTLTFASAASVVPVRIAIFPDRDGRDEDHTLTLRLNSAPLTNTFPLHVIDQDIARNREFAVTVDFSHDRSGFFRDPRARAIVEQAAADWAYFIGDMQLEPVPAGAETTYLWGTGDAGAGTWATNAAAYRGFLFYACGVHGPELRSSGGASDCSLQRSGEQQFQLRRSGSCVAETAGNYNSLGWLFTESDEDWCVSGNQPFEPNDFYSIAHHEVGHALFFSPAHPRFGEFKVRGALDAAAATNYQGQALALDGEDHFVRAIDRASGCGAFGAEYSGAMPRGRWLITKLDLLTARALGYTVRETSAFTPLRVAGGALPGATVGEPYTARIPAAGGTPAYDFAVVSAALPAGLKLDRFTGGLSGSPTVPGEHRFTVAVREQDARAADVRAEFFLTVAPAPALIAGAGRVGEQRVSAAERAAAPAAEFRLRAEPADGRLPSLTSPLYRVLPE